MSPALILALLNGVLGAAPQLLALFNRATSGEAVSPAEVQAVLTQYGIDRDALVSAIADAEKPPSA